MSTMDAEYEKQLIEIENDMVAKRF